MPMCTTSAWGSRGSLQRVASLSLSTSLEYKEQYEHFMYYYVSYVIRELLLFTKLTSKQCFENTITIMLLIY